MSKIVILGATGATGKAIIKHFMTTTHDIIAIARKPQPTDFKGKWIQQDSPTAITDLKPDHIICSLGTTKKAAGSAENFIKIDHDLVIEYAKMLHHLNPESTFTYVSSTGANPNSMFLYPKSKGKTELDLMAIGFKKCWILRPGLLLIDEKRPDQRWIEDVFLFLASILPFNELFAIKVTSIAKCMQHLIEKQPTQSIIEHKTIHAFSKS